MLLRCLFTGLFILIPAAVNADCLLSENGQVYCSSTPQGGIAKNAVGLALCGPGDCVTNDLGQVLCSKTAGGGAAIDELGRARCLDGCIQGSADSCTPAQP